MAICAAWRGLALEGDAVALDALVNRATKEAGTEPSPTIPAPEK